MLHNLQTYILTSIQNNKFYYFYFTKFYSLTCMCVHACRSMCMCIHEWKPEEGHWVSCTSSLLPHKGSLSRKVELSPSWLPVTWPASSPRGPDSPISSCPLQPLLPLVWLLVRVLGNWAWAAKALTHGAISPTFSYQILMYSGVHINQVIFYFFFKVNFTDKFINRKQSLPKNTISWGLSSI